MPNPKGTQGKRTAGSIIIVALVGLAFGLGLGLGLGANLVKRTIIVERACPELREFQMNLRSER